MQWVVPISIGEIMLSLRARFEREWERKKEWELNQKWGTTADETQSAKRKAVCEFGI